MLGPLAVPLAVTLAQAAAQAMAGRQGTVVVLEAATGRVEAAYHRDLAERRVVKPGSTVKPFTLLALLKAGPTGEIECGRTLRVGERNLSCTHPPAPGRLTAADALAYSCNWWFGAMAKRLEPEGLAAELRTAGFTVSGTPATMDELQLQALGEWGVTVTPRRLAEAYRRLARAAPAVVVEGLASAAAWGTARLAKPDGLEVAGKTGTATSEDRSYKHGWFAGFAPARAPRIIVVVFVEHGQGGGDAAPVARKVFEAWQRAH